MVRCRGAGSMVRADLWSGVDGAGPGCAVQIKRTTMLFNEGIPKGRGIPGSHVYQCNGKRAKDIMI